MGVKYLVSVQGFLRVIQPFLEIHIGLFCIVSEYVRRCLSVNPTHSGPTFRGLKHTSTGRTPTYSHPHRRVFESISTSFPQEYDTLPSGA